MTTPTLDQVVLPPTVVVVPGGDLFETSTAVFSQDQLQQYRYALTRQWDPDRPWMAYVMLNPSTADADVTDPTITRCRNRARQLGAGGLVVLNLFAVRATQPADMRAHPDPVGPANDQVITEYVTRLRPTVVAAWGGDVMVTRAGRDRTVLDLLASANTVVHRIGPATKHGHPGHPLYLPGSLSLEPHQQVA